MISHYLLTTRFIFPCSSGFFSLSLWWLHCSGTGFTKVIFSVLLFSKFSGIVKRHVSYWNHVYIWQVSPQLICSDTCQIWMWFNECGSYFCKKKFCLWKNWQTELWQHPPQACFTLTKPIIWLPQWKWINPEAYGCPSASEVTMKHISNIDQMIYFHWWIKYAVLWINNQG